MRESIKVFCRLFRSNRNRGLIYLNSQNTNTLIARKRTTTVTMMNSDGMGNQWSGHSTDQKLQSDFCTSYQEYVAVMKEAQEDALKIREAFQRLARERPAENGCHPISVISDNLIKYNGKENETAIFNVYGLIGFMMDNSDHFNYLSKSRSAYLKNACVKPILSVLSEDEWNREKIAVEKSKNEPENTNSYTENAIPALNSPTPSKIVSVTDANDPRLIARTDVRLNSSNGWGTWTGNHGHWNWEVDNKYVESKGEGSGKQPPARDVDNTKHEGKAGNSSRNVNGSSVTVEASKRKQPAPVLNVESSEKQGEKNELSVNGAWTFDTKMVQKYDVTIISPEMQMIAECQMKAWGYDKDEAWKPAIIEGEVEKVPFIPWLEAVIHVYRNDQSRRLYLDKAQRAALPSASVGASSNLPDPTTIEWDTRGKRHEYPRNPEDQEQAMELRKIAILDSWERYKKHWDASLPALKYEVNGTVHYLPGYSEWDGKGEMPPAEIDLITPVLLDEESRKGFWNLWRSYDKGQWPKTTKSFRRDTRRALFFLQFGLEIHERQFAFKVYNFWLDNIKDVACRARYAKVEKRDDHFLTSIIPLARDVESEKDCTSNTGFSLLYEWTQCCNRNVLVRLSKDCVNFLQNNVKKFQKFSVLQKTDVIYVDIEFVPVNNWRVYEFIVTRIGVFDRCTEQVAWSSQRGDNLGEGFGRLSEEKHSTDTQFNIQKKSEGVPRGQVYKISEKPEHQLEDDREIAEMEEWVTGTAKYD